MHLTHTNPSELALLSGKSAALMQDIHVILETSIGDHPSFDMLAGAFNMSGRTLRRQLACLGTSYQKLVDKFRCDYAVDCLKNSQMTTEDIAESLGFSDVANFRHAFKKWAGISPAAYRQQYLYAA